MDANGSEVFTDESFGVLLGRSKTECHRLQSVVSEISDRIKSMESNKKRRLTCSGQRYSMQCDDLRKECHVVEMDCGSLTNNCSDLINRLLETDSEDLKERIECYKDECDNHEDYVHGLVDRINISERSLKVLQKKKVLASKKLVGQTDQELAMKSQYDMLQTQRNKLVKELETEMADPTIKSVERDKKVLEEQIRQAQQRLNTWASKIQDLQKTVTEMETRFEDNKKRIEMYESDSKCLEAYHMELVLKASKEETPKIETLASEIKVFEKRVKKYNTVSKRLEANQAKFIIKGSEQETPKIGEPHNHAQAGEPGSAPDAKESSHNHL